MLHRLEEDHGARAKGAGEAGAAAAFVAWRPAGERFRTRIGWLESRHTFSFGQHHDPAWAGFRDLLVINDDRVAPAQGFGRHRHEDMEIVSYVLDGKLEHKDSLGNGSIMVPGDVQRMSAGTGVAHSEWNPAPEPVHFLQIWIAPERERAAPGYEQKRFAVEEKRGRLRLLGSKDGREGSVTIHQDVSLYASVLEPGERVAHRLEAGRHAWIHVVGGAVRVNDRPITEGDGAALGPGGTIEILGGEKAGSAGSVGSVGEVLLFDLR